MILKMINLIKYRLIIFYLFFLLNLLFFSQKIDSLENIKLLDLMLIETEVLKLILDKK